MAIGKQSKDGIIIKSKSGFQHYFGPHDGALRETVMPDDPKRKIKTMKVFDVVEIANNKISVKIYPDGRINIEPSV